MLHQMGSERMEEELPYCKATSLTDLPLIATQSREMSTLLRHGQEEQRAEKYLRHEEEVDHDIDSRHGCRREAVRANSALPCRYFPGHAPSA